MLKADDHNNTDCNMNISKIVISWVAVVLLASSATASITIDWKEESARLVTRGGYARIKAIDNHHAMVYGAGGGCGVDSPQLRQV